VGGKRLGQGQVRDRDHRWSAVTEKSNCTEWCINLGIKYITYKQVQVDVIKTLTHGKQAQHEYKTPVLISLSDIKTDI